MKQPPKFREAQARMQPGVITLDGFLGNDKRALVEIIDVDDATVQRLQITHAAIAHRMRALRRAGAKGLGEYINVSTNLDVRIESYRGRLRCPFNDSNTGKGVTRVRNLALNREIAFSDLAIHMIAQHGFYSGKGALFRLEPADLVAILEVHPLTVNGA